MVELEQLPYVDLPRGKNEGEIIPLDIEVPTPNEEGDAVEETFIEESDSENAVAVSDTTEEGFVNATDLDLEDDLIDPDDDDDWK